MMQLINNQYQIQGLNLIDVANQYETPVYVYDGDKIVNQYRKLSSAFGSTKVKIKYACKALTNINILKLLKNEGSGIDTVSIQEVWLAIKAGLTLKKFDHIHPTVYR